LSHSVVGEQGVNVEIRERVLYERCVIGAAKASPKALACCDGTLHPRSTGSQYGVGRGSRRNEYSNRCDIFH